MDTVFQKIVNLFQDVNHKLEVHITADELINYTQLVFHSMTKTARHFHTPEHIFNLANPDDPIQSLAALFHDLVYFQVDEGFSSEIKNIIDPYLIEKSGSLYLNENAPQSSLYLMLLEIFNYRKGQKLNPYFGMNEFLSALVMITCLAEIAPRIALVKASICIEATIPFRGIDHEGKNPLDHLEHRLRNIDSEYTLQLTEQEIIHTIECATRFSNKDVENFSESETSVFLDNTWKLLPEMNTSLRFKEVYTVNQYRKALLDMSNFLYDLNAQTIFNRYHTEPSPADYQQLQQYAQANIKIARQYLDIKLVTIAILEALCNLSGGDSPIANFMGPIDTNSSKQRLESHIPMPESTITNDQTILYRLLKNGRASESPFDKRDSPLSFYLYQNLGMEKMTGLLQPAKLLFIGEMQAMDFLHLFDQAVIIPVINASATLFTDRRKRLLQIAANLSG